MANLKKGSKGTEVVELQNLLNASGNYNLTTDGIFGDKTLAAVKDYQSKNGLTVDGIAGVNTLSKLKSNTATPSTTPTSAPVVNTTASTVTAPAGVTAPTQSATYADQINATLQQILQRKPLQYDFNGDPLYQMYKDSAMQNGQIASQDALARASALTGGYGNSYATQVAAQTAQQQMAGLNEKIPELEQLAQARYAAETDRLTNNLGILSDLENQEYTRQWNEDQRKYEREQDAIALKQQQNEAAWERQYALARLAAEYGDTSGLKDLGIDVSQYTSGTGTNIGVDEDTSKWTYDQYVKFMDEDPPYDRASANTWAQKIVESYLAGRMNDTQFFTLIDKYPYLASEATAYAERKRRQLANESTLTKPTPELIAKLDEWQRQNK